MAKGWWWETAERKKRLRFAILMLAVEATLFAWAISNPHNFFSSVTGWTWAITAPVLIPFFAMQAWRARRE
jgi:hypothetical protein